MIDHRDLTIDEISPSEEIRSYILNLVKLYFSQSTLSKKVEVDDYMDDFNPSSFGDLLNRAQRSTVCLFDVVRISPVSEEERRGSHERLGRDEYTFGFYICSSSMRDSKGVDRKIESFKAISLIQKILRSTRIPYTVDKAGNTNTCHARPLEIEKIQNIPNLCVFQVMYTCIVSRDLYIDPPVLYGINSGADSVVNNFDASIEALSGNFVNLYFDNAYIELIGAIEEGIIDSISANIIVFRQRV